MVKVKKRSKRRGRGGALKSIDVDELRVTREEDGKYFVGVFQRSELVLSFRVDPEEAENYSRKHFFYFFGFAELSSAFRRLLLG